ncbi:hypothetical protein HK405_010673 [Cladochytrium tenue]|nr:hypothetical protein HK405_010673 [Cladochytrium tenue]
MAANRGGLFVDTTHEFSQRVTLPAGADAAVAAVAALHAFEPLIFAQPLVTSAERRAPTPEEAAAVAADPFMVVDGPAAATATAAADAGPAMVVAYSCIERMPVIPGLREHQTLLWRFTPRLTVRVPVLFVRTDTGVRVLVRARYGPLAVVMRCSYDVRRPPTATASAASAFEFFEETAVTGLGFLMAFVVPSIESAHKEEARNFVAKLATACAAGSTIPPAHSP